MILVNTDYISGKELEKRLDRAHITCNKNTIPFDPASPNVTSGVRLGTPAVTTRGMKEEDMETIAKLIAMAIFDFENKADEIRAGVKALCDKELTCDEKIFSKAVISSVVMEDEKALALIAEKLASEYTFLNIKQTTEQVFRLIKTSKKL